MQRLSCRFFTATSMFFVSKSLAYRELEKSRDLRTRKIPTALGEQWVGETMA